MSQHTPADVKGSNLQDDEIDLLGLIRALLKTWKIWIISLVVVTGVFGAFMAFKFVVTTPETVYSKPIRLTFPDAHLQKFPSGAEFFYSDIVAPAVAQQVFERNRLDTYGLTIADFQGGLSATPYSPTYPLIIERYNRLLSDKKLTSDNIADIQKQMQQEVTQATAGEVLISWRLDKHAVPRDVAEKVLIDLPTTWAEKAIKENGVLEIKAHLTTAKSLNLPLIEQAELLVAGDILADKLKQLKNNIKELNTFEGSQTITDPKTGMRLSDLGNAVDDLDNYVIGSTLASVRLQGLSNSPAGAEYYYTDKLNKLNVKLKGFEYQATALRDSYRQFNKSTGLATGENNNNQAIAPQLNTDMFDKLASLSSDMEREKYNQKLNDKWLKLSIEISELKSNIVEAEQQLSAFKNHNGSNSSTLDILAQAKERLPGILDKMVEYFDISERIAAQFRTATMGIKDQLFIPVTNKVLVNREQIEVKTLLLTWIALMFLTSVIVIPTSMIRNALSAKKLDQN